MNWHKLFYIFLAVLCLSGCSIKQRIKRADKKFAIGEYYTAADIYKSCYSQLSMKKERELKGYVAYKQGECYRLINNPRATNCYQSALRCKYHLQDSTIFLNAGLALQYQGKSTKTPPRVMISICRAIRITMSPRPADTPATRSTSGKRRRVAIRYRRRRSLARNAQATSHRCLSGTIPMRSCSPATVRRKARADRRR